MHRTADQLIAGLEHVRQSPREQGRLQAIVVRPQTEQRQTLQRCHLDLSAGAEGDRWVNHFPVPPTPGAPELDSQLTLMNSRAADLIAGSQERWALAGDQLYVDLDLSEDHLRAGDRLHIGAAIVEITAKAHNGCRKFAARFGDAALAWVNSSEGKHLHLRGIYAKVITPGEVRVGDTIQKISVAQLV